MELQSKGDCWWIVGVPDDEYPECGPYDTKSEAASDMRGLKRYFKNINNRSFFTYEPPPRTLTEP